MNSGETVRAYHEWTSNSTGPVQRRPPRPADYTQLDPRREPALFKRYPTAEPHHLPAASPLPGPIATDVLAGRVKPADTPLDATLLTQLLLLSVGVTRKTQRNGRPVYRRPASSAGNRHPLEAYVVAGEINGLSAGLYHYAPDLGVLEQLLDGDHRGAVAAAADTTPAEAYVVLTGLPWRTAWKYAERGWRHLYWDAGTALANFLALAEAYGLPARLLFGFEDDALRTFLGVDGRTEIPLMIVALGSTTDLHISAAQPLPEPIEPRTKPIEFPLITVAQQAGVLPDVCSVGRWRSAFMGTPATASPAALPASAPGTSIEDLIERRITTRRMNPIAVPAELLTWSMHCATRPVPMDAVPTGHTLLTHYLSVHGVTGVASGTYSYQKSLLSSLQPLHETEARDQAARNCLNQPVAGEAAYTLFASTDLDELLDTLGDRGYRMAQTEAGIVVGRLQLAAAALGFGASGLTFFDQAVADMFATSRSAMLACAVGARPSPV
ncbi:SagB family peptide dehydrogenase [Streptomyces virginiae]|uniref:SagB family peptide dehydrogenase n=1 Tax=Streptomyces virginiae TaxID=1961 RepID=UPI0036A38CF4